MNVDFVKDDYRFNARASAIILNEKRIKFYYLRLKMVEIIFYYQVEELNYMKIV